MSLGQYFVVAVALATFRGWQWVATLYWNPPKLIAPGLDGGRHEAHLARVGIQYFGTWTVPLVCTATTFLLTPWWNWSRIDPTLQVRAIVLITSGVITWRGVTMDIDLVTGRAQVAHRSLMIALWVGLWFHPGFLIPLLHVGITWLRCWYLHQHLPIRVLQMFLGCSTGWWLVSLVAELRGVGEPARGAFLPPFLFVALCVVASHYFTSGIKKLRLGPRWHSWLRRDRLHQLTVGAYTQGWLGWWPEKRLLRLVRWLRPFDPLAKLGVLVLELSAIGLLMDPRLAVGLLVGLAGFHLVIFALSGIFFWQFVVSNLVLAGVVIAGPEGLIGASFGPLEGLIGIGVVLAFPHRRKIWKPIGLGWWDSPFYGRAEREVRGRSGTWYGLHNDFLCPHERLFGQRYGDFLVHDPHLTSHLGEVERFTIYRALMEMEDVSELQAIKDKYGVDPYDAEQAADHDRILRTFIQNFNAGRPKRVCPRWLKAPGGQMFYWGALPRFTGQEPIDRLVVRYRERWFDGERIVAVADRVISTTEFSQT